MSDPVSVTPCGVGAKGYAARTVSLPQGPICAYTIKKRSVTLLLISAFYTYFIEHG